MTGRADEKSVVAPCIAGVIRLLGSEHKKVVARSALPRSQIGFEPLSSAFALTGRLQAAI